MKPKVTLLMITSVDGRLHPSRFTSSPDGTRRDWSAQYEKVHEALKADAWLVGRVTMAEISKAGPHAPSKAAAVERPLHIASKSEGSYAIALDPSGKVHFKPGGLGGDHVIALLGRDVPDSHLAELAADGVSYIVSDRADIDIAAMLDVLGREFGIRHLVLEGGAGTNGTFLAAGLVDEMRILVAPAIDGGENVQGIVAYGDGLAGKLALQLKSADTLEHGVVQLHYAVLPPGH
ncbi:RibD family protein [Bradyrhizobium sp. BRP22]|uniref:dihydrofolate reductase family protein n=1 Tax=Bradyrhizobium sp. BRP22 TaxID=2793821 RepID=UPI001CD249E6|nr:dihydrofolate reductase family protein [Bradyrhizobium sp. BRP22]MCA1454390.1 RibD family protein [Bradyrhizobium sp. BRP22]